MERSKTSSGCSQAIKQDCTRAISRRKERNCGDVIVEGPHDPRGDEGDAASGEVEGGVGHAARSSSACAASSVRLSVGRSPVSKREMLDCVRPRRSAISACDNPRASRICLMLCMAWVYAHTHSLVNPSYAFAVLISTKGGFIKPL